MISHHQQKNLKLNKMIWKMKMMMMMMKKMRRRRTRKRMRRFV
jgi:hypothetical protein